MRAKTAILLLVASCILQGCGLHNRANRPLFNAAEKYLVPKTQPARALSFPVTVPLSIAAVTVDMLLIHPLMELPRAYGDTKDALWDLHWRDWRGDQFTMASCLLPRVAATPVVFAGDWLRLSIGAPDASARRNPVEAAGRSDDALSRLRELAEKKDRAGFLAAADNLCPANPNLQECRKAEGLRALDARDFDRMAGMQIGWRDVAWRDGDLSILSDALRNGDGAMRASTMSYMAGRQFPRDLIPNSPALLDAIGGLTVGADKALALQSVQLLAQCPPSDGVKAVLEGTATGADPVLAYHASKALKRQQKQKQKR